jgi:hypothetical protein
MLKRSHFAKGAGILLLLGCAAVAQPPAGFPGGRFELPKPGEVLPGLVQQRLKLTAEQKKELAEVQKDVDAKLEKILTADQRKSLKEMRERPGPGFGPPGPFGGPGGFPGGGFGPFGGFGTVRLDDVKKAIEATDEEWKVIGPKLQKVIAARQVLTTESRSADTKAAPRAEPRPNDAAPRGDGQRPAAGGAAEANIITQAHADFKAVLDDPKRTKAELQDAAAAVRKARDKARTDLAAAQKDLRQLLTAEQETILLGLGYLD